jgi:hypothetical protein
MTTVVVAEVASAPIRDCGWNFWNDNNKQAHKQAGKKAGTQAGRQAGRHTRVEVSSVAGH